MELIAFIIFLIFFAFIDESQKNKNEQFDKAITNVLLIAIFYILSYSMFSFMIFTALKHTKEYHSLISKMIVYGFAGLIASQYILIPKIMSLKIVSFKQLRAGLHAAGLFTMTVFFILDINKNEQIRNLIITYKSYFTFSTIFYLISSIIVVIYEDVSEKEQQK